jgi:hypothetical protein
MNFTHWGCPVVVLGYFGLRVLIRMPRGGAPIWVSAEDMKCVSPK